MRKFLVIFVIILIVAVVAGIVFAFLSTNKQPQEEAPLQNVFPISLFYPKASPSPGFNGNQEQPEQPTSDAYQEKESAESSTPRPISLSNEEVYGYWVSSSTVYFLTKEGELKKNDGTGEFSLLSYSYGMPIGIAQNASGTAAAVTFDSGSTYVYQSASNAWELLGTGITDLAFSPDGEALLALKEQGMETFLVKYEPFVTPEQTTTLLRLSAADLRVQWPSPNQVVITSVPSYFSDGQVWRVNLRTGTIQKIISGKGADALTSQYTQNLLLFRSESKGSMLAGTYSPEGSLINLYSRMLIAAKCGNSLNDAVIWCGSPQLLPAGSFTLPDDYLKRKIFTHDELVSIHLDTGEFFMVPFTSDSYVDMSEVKHTHDAVYFVNRFDDRIYMLNVGM